MERDIKFACINFILYIFYPRKIFREHLCAPARDYRVELSLPPKPSLLAFCSTPSGSAPPLAKPRQKIEFGSALYAECASDLFISWWAVVCARARRNEKEREREAESERVREVGRPIPSPKINELDNQLLFFFLLCDGNGNHVSSWHPRWSTICMQIGAELNPPSDWQIVNRGWEFGDGFSLSTLPVDALHRYRDYVSYFHRTRKNSCPNINWTVSRENSWELPAKMYGSYLL